MTNTLDRQAFIEFLRVYLRPQDFKRFAIASSLDEKSRFLFRMTQKLNDFEYVVIVCQNQQSYVNFIPSSIATRPFSELKDADFIPDVLYFTE